jgi:hypothetical protein
MVVYDGFLAPRAVGEEPESQCTKKASVLTNTQVQVLKSTKQLRTG